MAVYQEMLARGLLLTNAAGASAPAVAMTAVTGLAGAGAQLPARGGAAAREASGVLCTWARSRATWRASTPLVIGTGADRAGDRSGCVAPSTSVQPACGAMRDAVAGIRPASMRWPSYSRAARPAAHDRLAGAGLPADRASTRDLIDAAHARRCCRRRRHLVNVVARRRAWWRPTCWRRSQAATWPARSSICSPMEPLPDGEPASGTCRPSSSPRTAPRPSGRAAGARGGDLLRSNLAGWARRGGIARPGGAARVGQRRSGPPRRPPPALSVRPAAAPRRRRSARRPRAASSAPRGPAAAGSAARVSTG